MTKSKIVIISVVCLAIILSVVLGCTLGIKHTVTLDYSYSEGGRIIRNPVIETKEVRNNSPYSPPRPTREGYTFAGWYKDAGYTVAWVNGEKIKSDITLYAKWV